MRRGDPAEASQIGAMTMKGIAIIAAATLALSAPAFARRPAGAYQVGNDSYHLFYDDLDMNSLTGRAELLKRVETVAKKLCAQPLKVDERACVAGVTAGIAKPELVQALAERNATRFAAR